MISAGIINIHQAGLPETGTDGGEVIVVFASTISVGVAEGPGVFVKVGPGVFEIIGVIDGVTDGVIDGVTDGVTEGVIDGVIERVGGVTDGVIDGVTEGVGVFVTSPGGVGVGVLVTCGGVGVLDSSSHLALGEQPILIPPLTKQCFP